MQAPDNEPPFVRAVAGALASMTGEAVTLPVDTVKIRLQLAGEGVATSGKSLGLVGTARSIVAGEGVVGLFKGLGPGLVRQASYQSLKMGMYEPLRDAVLALTGRSEANLFDRIAAGGTAGAIGAAIANPTDLVKVRLQADTTGARYTGMMQTVMAVYKSEGVLAFWKGVVPNVYRAFIVNAAELATYDTVKLFFLRNELIGDNVANHFVSSFTAGFVAALTSTPVDLAKTRLMNQPMDPVTGKGLKYSGMTDCLVKTARTEGVQGLYKGFLATWLRIGPWAVVMFMTYELYRKAFHTALGITEMAGNALEDTDYPDIPSPTDQDDWITIDPAADSGSASIIGSLAALFR